MNYSAKSVDGVRSSFLILINLAAAYGSVESEEIFDNS
jgi:hypothetical protein